MLFHLLSAQSISLYRRKCCSQPHCLTQLLQFLVGCIGLSIHSGSGSGTPCGECEITSHICDRRNLDVNSPFVSFAAQPQPQAEIVTTEAVVTTEAASTQAMFSTEAATATATTNPPQIDPGVTSGQGAVTNQRTMPPPGRGGQGGGGGSVAAPVAVTVVLFLLTSLFVACVFLLVYCWRKNKLGCLRGKGRIVAMGKLQRSRRNVMLCCSIPAAAY